MGSYVDLTGHRYGRLVVLERNGHIGTATAWKCRCDCGTEGTWRGNSLRTGLTTSCGCYHKERASEANITHGMTDSPEFNTWLHILQRCTNPNVERYDNYGGRGISVCSRWTDSFKAFYEDMGPRPGPEYSIERDDVHGNYEPGNCRWATEFEQSRNRTTNRAVVYKGKEYIAKDLAIETNVSYFQLRYHLDQGRSGDEAVEFLLAKKG
jgi:hypothetical protein